MCARIFFLSLELRSCDGLPNTFSKKKLWPSFNPIQFYMYYKTLTQLIVNDCNSLMSFNHSLIKCTLSRSALRVHLQTYNVAIHIFSYNSNDYNVTHGLVKKKSRGMIITIQVSIYGGIYICSSWMTMVPCQGQLVSHKNPRNR